MSNLPTLSKFGVPLDGRKLGILHPKQQYRFRVVFYGFGADNVGIVEMTASVVTATRPKLSHDEATLHSYNSVAWIMGKHEFEPLEVVLRDDITNSVASAIGGQMQKQMNHYEQTTAVAGVNYKFTMEIHSLDGTNNDELEAWVVEGCWIKNYNPGDFDYTTGEVVTNTLEIRFDNAVNITGRNTNLGTTVGGDPYPNFPSPRGGTTFA